MSTHKPSPHFTEFIELAASPLSYENNSTALIIGVGLMGQHMASHIIQWLNLKKLILVDHSNTISVGTNKMSLADFAKRWLRDGACKVSQTHFVGTDTDRI